MGKSQQILQTMTAAVKVPPLDHCHAVALGKDDHDGLGTDADQPHVGVKLHGTRVIPGAVQLVLI